MGRAWELVAVGNEVVSLRDGSTLREATDLMAAALVVREPWATGVAVVERGDPVTRIVVLDAEETSILGADGDRRIERLELKVEDADVVAELWGLHDASTRVDERELARCLLLRAALRAGMLPDVVCSRWSGGDLEGLARDLDLPAGGSVRALYAVAHAADIATHHPGVDASEDAAVQVLQAVVPPRWVLAEEMRKSGRSDLFEMIMEAPADS